MWDESAARVGQGRREEEQGNGVEIWKGVWRCDGRFKVSGWKVSVRSLSLSVVLCMILKIVMRFISIMVCLFAL